MMKTQIIATLVVAACLIPASSASAQGELPIPTNQAFRTNQQRTSYAIGLNFVKRLDGDGISVNRDALLQGIQDALAKKKPALSDVEIRQTLEQLDRAIAEKQRQRWESLAARNKKEGPAFLTRNRTQRGVVTLSSGLQYRVIKTGKGAVPRATDQVRTHYRGTLLDGTEFDSSYSRGQAAEFPVSGVIRGWSEALQRMRVGDKWQLYIPSELAYGPRGVEPIIGPHAVLIFEVELLGIK